MNTIRSTKIKLIKKYGTDVEIQKSGSLKTTAFNEKALLGKATKAITAMIMLESFKEGLFLPESNISGGDFVYSHPHNESYVVSAVHQEYYGNQTLSNVTMLLKCNRLINIKDETTQSDNRGNLITSFADTYTDLPCYLQEVTSSLRQVDSGLSPETDYVIYTTGIPITENGQILIDTLSGIEQLKVVSTDYVSFPNMVVIQVKRDIRG